MLAQLRFALYALLTRQNPEKDDNMHKRPTLLTMLMITAIPLAFSQTAPKKILDQFSLGEESYHIIKDLNMQERKKIFNELDAESRQSLWISHIEYFIYENEHKYPTESIMILEELLVFITESKVFFHGLVDHKDAAYNLKELNEIEQDIYKSFGVYGVEILTLLGGQPTGNEAPNQIYDPCRLPGDCIDCECHKGGVNYCLGHPNTCKTSNHCHRTERGCGTLWLWECNGMCGI